MRNSKIKALFEKAEEQIQVDEIRKQETYNMMLETMEKQRTPMMSIKNILLHQIWYMDKVFFIIYGVIICLGIVSIAALQYIGVNQNEIIIACMVGAGILSVVSTASAVKKMYMLPVSVPAMYLCKFLILTVMFLVAIVLQNLALAQIGMTDLPDGAFEMGTLVRFAGYSFLTSMPVLSFMLLISSRFENMWVPLGIGVAGFLSGMALANSGLTLLLVHPFVIILKPAVAMSAQPDSTVALVALVETLLFLAVGLWLAKYRRYE